MSKENPIGLAELIEQVKQELLSTQMDAKETVPLFSVDEVSLELKLAVRKEGKAGLQIHVVELGAGVGRDDVQTVKVTLSPLISKEDRVRLFKTRYPERWQALEETSIEAALKGSESESLSDLYGG
jgi:hypothetical protein